MVAENNKINIFKENEKRNKKKEGGGKMFVSKIETEFIYRHKINVIFFLIKTYVGCES